MALTSPAAIAREVSPEAVRRQLTSQSTDWSGRAFQAFLWLSLLTSLGVLVVLLGSQIYLGSGVLAERGGDFLTGTLRSNPAEAGIQQGIRGTFWITLIVAVVAFPLGIAAAIYLEQYAPHSRVTRFITINVRNLAGVPSVVYGILGLTIFVNVLGDFTGGKSVISGGLAVAILVLPIVIITSAEAIRAVPASLSDGCYGLGATRWEVVRTVVLPYAAPGILTGTMLSIAQAMGQAAPLILVGAVSDRLGSNPGIFDASSLDERFTALPNVIDTFAKRPQEGFEEITAAAIIVMLVLVLAVNFGAILLRNRYANRRK